MGSLVYLERDLDQLFGENLGRRKFNFQILIILVSWWPPKDSPVARLNQHRRNSLRSQSDHLLLGWPLGRHLDPAPRNFRWLGFGTNQDPIGQG